MPQEWLTWLQENALWIFIAYFFLSSVLSVVPSKWAPGGIPIGMFIHTIIGNLGYVARKVVPGLAALFPMPVPDEKKPKKP